MYALLFMMTALLFTASALPPAGSPAPAFRGEATDGAWVSLDRLKGSWAVLYFYPKAFTPGCTAEACALRDGFRELEAAGVKIYGVSLDGPDTLKKFKEKYSLPFDLISDRDKAISRAYGVLGVGGLYAERKTFIIDPRGNVAYVFDKVDTKHHDREVLDMVKQLQAKG